MTMFLKHDGSTTALRREQTSLKFLLEEWGPRRFREELERRLGRKLNDGYAPYVPVTANRAHVGIHPQKQHGLFYAGVATKRGRLPGTDMIAVAELARRHGGGRVRLTTAQNLVVLDVPEAERERLAAGLAALDLTVLFNGFKPLFQALSPEDVNQLSYELIQVFKGEGGTLEGLLAHTASVTSTLADRDEVIGDLIDNLSLVLDHVADRDKQLTRLIQSFRTLVGGEAKGYTKLLADSRLEAVDRLRAAAAQVGGNAVVAMRFDTGEIADMMNEVAAYGTAVTVERVS